MHEKRCILIDTPEEYAGNSVVSEPLVIEQVNTPEPVPFKAMPGNTPARAVAPKKRRKK